MLLSYSERDTGPRNVTGQSCNVRLAVVVREAGKRSVWFSGLVRGGRQGKGGLGMNVE